MSTAAEGRTASGRAPDPENPLDPGDAPIEVGVNERPGILTAVGLGFQHILGLAGLLLFPAIFGKSFGLSPHDTAYVYGITFLTSGVVVILQAVGLLRLPIVQGPFAGIFAALLSVGHQVGLDKAYGSLVVASAAWCLLALPLRRWSAVARLARSIDTPLVSGVILLVISAQLGTIVMPAYFGTKADGAAFPWVNLGCAVLSLVVVVLCVRSPVKLLRRGAMLWGVIVGAVAYTVLGPTHWNEIAHASAFNGLRWLPFGFGVDAASVLVFLIAWFPAISESIATYGLVADWTGEPLPPRRVAQGVFGELVGSTAGALLGGMSAMAYPANVGLLKVTRVASRWVTLTTGIILVVLGGFGYFDALLAAIPQPVLSGATTVLFGLIFAAGLQLLARVRWTQDTMLAAGAPVIMAIGLLLTPATVTGSFPSWLTLIVGQPLVVAVVLSLVATSYLAWRSRSAPSAGPVEEPSAGAAPDRPA